MDAQTPAFKDDSVIMEIMVRAYAVPQKSEDSPEAAGDANGKGRVKMVPRAGPNDLALIFDVETTVDAAQRLRCGVWQLRQSDRLVDEGIIFEPALHSAEEIRTVQAYAREHRLKGPVSTEEFRNTIFLPAYWAGAIFVGFNLGFDLARVALDARPAKATSYRRKMKGGFSLKFSDSDRQPSVQLKHVNPRFSFIEFTSVRKARTSRSVRGRKRQTPVDRGHFVDVRTLSSAILSGSYTLEKLTRKLDTPTKKTASDDHGGPLTPEYLNYARGDVQATWECFVALRQKYESFGLGRKLWDISSEAGIGKAVLSKIGVKPWLKSDPDTSPERIGRIISTYYGGRTEVRIRRQVVRVVQTDFTSMYPTVCVLLGSWRYLTAERVTERDATAETRAFLATATPELFQDQDTWKRLNVIVRLRPDRDFLPVRGPYDGEKHASIGLNYLTNPNEPMWFTLADCLNAKFLSGRTPEIEYALAFDAGPVQSGLQKTRLFNGPFVDPYQDDLYRTLIRVRETERMRSIGLSIDELERIEDARQAIKITANSTSYGISVQLNVTPEPKGVQITVHNGTQEPFGSRATKSEEPGPYFHPLLGTLTTGAARLMLGLAQYRAHAEGLEYAFCDTDSLALAQIGETPDDAFAAAADRVVQWFRPLNPYGFDESILKVEDINFRDGTKTPEPLYCFAISSKRYVLFNLDPEGRPVIRKASAHGLGHLLEPYGDGDGPKSIPPPLASVRSGKDRLPRWQYDVWYTIAAAALAGTPDRVKFDYHPALSRPAVSRYGATSPEMLGWFDAYNEGGAYDDTVKPYGFMYALHVKRRRAVDDEAGLQPGRRVDNDLHPVAPFARTRDEAIARAFDRVTGARVPIGKLQTYAEALSPYPFRQEAKFRNGRPYQSGLTEPRHVKVASVFYIGKEADRWEEEYLIGLGISPTTEFGRAPSRVADVARTVQEDAGRFGAKAVADATGISRGAVTKIAAGETVRIKVPPARVAAGLDMLRLKKAEEVATRETKRADLEAAIEREGGVRPAARALGLDPSNLSKRRRASKSR